MIEAVYIHYARESEDKFKGDQERYTQGGSHILVFYAGFILLYELKAL